MASFKQGPNQRAKASAKKTRRGVLGKSVKAPPGATRVTVRLQGEHGKRALVAGEFVLLEFSCPPPAGSSEEIGDE